MADKSRFIQERVLNKITQSAVIYTDKKTGVQYLFVSDGYAGGLTLLVDKEGKPLLNRDYEKDLF